MEEKYKLIAAADKQIMSGERIDSNAIFEASLLSQIGIEYKTENLIEVYPPPILFIEIWNFFNDNRIFEFNNFNVNVNGQSFEYICVGALIHTKDHFKTVAFDSGHKILLDDAIVADLSNNEKLNIFKESELQDLQTNIKMIVYQIKDDQFDEYFNIEI